MLPGARGGPDACDGPIIFGGGGPPAPFTGCDIPSGLPDAAVQGRRKISSLSLRRRTPSLEIEATRPIPCRVATGEFT